MKVLSLLPEQRLNQTKFFRVDNSEKGSTEQLVYTCPGCQHETHLFITDLIKNPDLLKNSDSANSGEDGLFYKSVFDQEPYPEKSDKNLHWDFYCAYCGQPVRVIYYVSPVHHNSYSLRIIRLLEAVNPSFPSGEELLIKLNRLVDLFYSLSYGQDISCYSYLWLTSLILLPCGYDSPNEMARVFFQEKKKFDLMLSGIISQEEMNNTLPVLFHGQFFLLFATIFKHKRSVEAFLKKASEIYGLLRQYGLANGSHDFGLALMLSIRDYSVEEIVSRLDSIAYIKASYKFPKDFDSSLCPDLWVTILGTLNNFQGNREYIQHINQYLERKDLPFAGKERDLASLFLWLKGGKPEKIVERFIKVGKAFSMAAANMKISLAQPFILPGDEDHPFREVVHSFLNELSLNFPFDFSSVLPIALLSNLPWRAEEMAQESLKLYGYLRSYRKFISPSVSFWVVAGLLFSFWEGENFSEILLFWILTGLVIVADIQYQEEFLNQGRLPEA